MTRTTITQKLTAAAIFFTALTAADANDTDTFLDAARSGDVAQAQSLLAGGFDVNARDDSGNTALQLRRRLRLHRDGSDPCRCRSRC